MKHLQFASISLLNIPLWKRRFVGFLGFIFANCFGECTKSQYDSTKKDARSAKGNKNLHIQSMSYGRPTLPIFRWKNMKVIKLQSLEWVSLLGGVLGQKEKQIYCHESWSPLFTISITQVGVLQHIATIYVSICFFKVQYLYINIYILYLYIYICILRSAKWTRATNKAIMVGLIKSSSRLSDSSWCSRDISLIFRVTAYGAENPCFHSKLLGLRLKAINFMQVPIDHEQAEYVLLSMQGQVPPVVISSISRGFPPKGHTSLSTPILGSIPSVLASHNIYPCKIH